MLDLVAGGSLAGLQVPDPDLTVGGGTDEGEGCRMELDQAGRRHGHMCLVWVRGALTGRTSEWCAVAALCQTTHKVQRCCHGNTQHQYITYVAIQSLVLLLPCTRLKPI